MSNLAIIRPLPGAAYVNGALTNGARIFTPDPKEVATGNGDSFFRVDLGRVETVSAIYLGGNIGRRGFRWRGGAASYVETALRNIGPAQKRTDVGPFQILDIFDPVALRYLEFYTDTGGGFGPAEGIGVLAIGETFRPTFGHEWGAGRYLVDTSTVSRNRAGGFGIDRGAIVPGWEFTLGDLTEEERERLFDMVRKLGESSPVIVCEDPDNTADLDARIHYGLFQRLEKYDRQSVGVTRWSFKVEEWT